MLAEAYLSPTLPAVHPGDSAAQVLRLMEQHQTRHLAVIDEAERFLGITEKKENTDFPILSIIPGSEQLSVTGRQHIFDALQIFYEHGLSIIPVVSENQRYLGTIGLEELAKCFAIMTGAEEKGDIIVLEMQKQDYSLTRLASIVEAEQCKIIGVFIHPVPDSLDIYVTLKITGYQLHSIVLSLERFGFKIAYTFSDQSYLLRSQDRYEILMRFLAI
ncbi:MAG: CBS domain-containing protein [Bacteroidia bacterium]|nr:CBS domain-containing protein [Bacteroidia bacterium]MDW8158888.1 CBS domain-containing protein [Bacteroidia bacterium]